MPSSAWLAQNGASAPALRMKSAQSMSLCAPGPRESTSPGFGVAAISSAVEFAASAPISVAKFSI